MVGIKINNICIKNRIVSSVMLMYNTRKQIRKNNSPIEYGLDVIFCWFQLTWKWHRYIVEHWISKIFICWIFFINKFYIEVQHEKTLTQWRFSLHLGSVLIPLCCPPAKNPKPKQANQTLNLDSHWLCQTKACYTHKVQSWSG